DPRGYGEGQTYLGSTTVTTDAHTDLASFTVTFPVSTVGKVVTATATDDNGNTSEFAQDFTAAATQNATTTTIHSSANPTTVGHSVTFTVTVTSPTGLPFGDVTLMDGMATLASGTTNEGGDFIFTTSDLSLGTHALTATYHGTSSFS